MEEHETINYVLRNRVSFARYGDGDFGVLRGQKDRFQRADPDLAAAIAESLRRPARNVLNCIIPPPKASSAPFIHRWHAYTEANAGIIPFLGHDVYGSANISRMDSEPHLRTISWWNTVAKLWDGRKAALVAGGDRSLTVDQLMGSPRPPVGVTLIESLRMDSWKIYDQLYQDCIASGAEVVLLCTGLVSRPLVHRLSEAGLLAYDLGHFGLWFKDGQPRPPEECRP